MEYCKYYFKDAIRFLPNIIPLKIDLILSSNKIIPEHSRAISVLLIPPQKPTSALLNAGA
jgi:hypothetical protein